MLAKVRRSRSRRLRRWPMVAATTAQRRAVEGGGDGAEKSRVENKPQRSCTDQRLKELMEDFEIRGF